MNGPMNEWSEIHSALKQELLRAKDREDKLQRELSLFTIKALKMEMEGLDDGVIRAQEKRLMDDVQRWETYIGKIQERIRIARERSAYTDDSDKKVIVAEVNENKAPVQPAAKDSREKNETPPTVQKKTIQIKIGPNESLVEYTKRFNYLSSRMPDLPMSTLEEAYLNGLKSKEDLYKDLNRAMETEQRWEGKRMDLSRIQTTAIELDVTNAEVRSVVNIVKYGKPDLPDDDRVDSRDGRKCPICGKSHAMIECTSLLHCSLCGKTGHREEECGKCYKCGMTGHRKSDCTKPRMTKRLSETIE